VILFLAAIPVLLVLIYFLSQRRQRDDAGSDSANVNERGGFIHELRNRSTPIFSSKIEKALLQQVRR
jgi:hypothetical protein